MKVTIALEEPTSTYLMDFQCSIAGLFGWLQPESCMLFAPETSRESLINQQDEEAAQIESAELENRLALLEKRLALLVGS